MTICEVCGNEYDQSSELWLAGEIQTFDSIECAFYAVAPRCAYCERRIIKQGIEAGGILFCCAHCAHQHEAIGLQDQTYEYSLGNISYTVDEAVRSR